MSRTIKAGSADQSTTIRMLDADGLPVTDADADTAGLALAYRREGGMATTITPTDLTALNDTHTDGGLLHIGDGYYRLDLPDAAVASGATGVLITGHADDVTIIGAYHQLVAYDPDNANNMGMAYLPDALSLANINAQVDTALIDYDAPTKAEMDAAFSSLTLHGDGAWGSSGLTAEAIWAYTLPSSPAAGSAAASLLAAGSAGDPWATFLPGSYTAGQAGFLFDVIFDHTKYITAGRVQLVTAMIDSGRSLVLVRGDDYITGSPRGPLVWQPADDSDWPDLTDATVRMTCRRTCDDSVAFMADGDVANPDGPGKQIVVDLSGTSTASLPPSRARGDYKFDVQVTLSDGAKWTPVVGGGPLQAGGVVIVEDQTRAS